MRAGTTIADRSSALGQLQLDAAIAAVGIVAVCGVERLVVGEPGGGQPIGRHALRDQVLHDGDGA